MVKKTATIQPLEYTFIFDYIHRTDKGVDPYNYIGRYAGITEYILLDRYRDRFKRNSEVIDNDTLD